MKFKTLLFFITAFATILLGVTMQGKASASVYTYGNDDVGWQAPCDYTFDFAGNPDFFCQNGEKKTHYSVVLTFKECSYKAGEPQKVSPNKTWVGADTKARLESTASVSIFVANLVTPSSSLKFGKGTKRLIY